MQVRWRNNTDHLCHNKGLEISAPENRSENKSSQATSTS